MRRNGKRAGRLIGIFIALIIVAGAAVYGYPYFQDFMTWREQEEEFKALLSSDRFYDGITIDGADVGGRTFDEVAEALDSRDQTEKDSVNIKLTYSGINYVLNGEEAGLMFDSRDVAREAYMLGRTGTEDERRIVIERLRTEGTAFKTSSAFGEMAVYNFVKKVSGYILADTDTDALYAEVCSALTDRRYSQTIAVQATPRTARNDIEVIPDDESISSDELVTTGEPPTAENTDAISEASGEPEEVTEPTPDPEPTPEPTPTAVRLHKTDWVNVRDFIPALDYMMVYATTDNVFATQFYETDDCVLRAGTVIKLRKAQELAQKDGYYIRIYDAYRPLTAHRKMHSLTTEKDYIENPRDGSPQNRGATVEITLLRDGVELDMPTAYGTFSGESSRNSQKMSNEQRANLDYLTSIMEEAGFAPVDMVWWRYDDTDYEKYAVADASFEDILSNLQY